MALRTVLRGRGAGVSLRLVGDGVVSPDWPQVRTVVIDKVLNRRKVTGRHQNLNVNAETSGSRSAQENSIEKKFKPILRIKIN